MKEVEEPQKLNVVGDQRDVKISRQLHLDYLAFCSPSFSRPNWYLKEEVQKPFFLLLFHSSLFHQEKLPHTTPCHRQPSVACSPSVLFFYYYFLLLHYKLIIFVREKCIEENKTKQGGGPLQHIGSRLYFQVYFILHSPGLFLSFSYVVLTHFSVFNRYPFGFLLLFYILEKDLVNYRFLPLRNEAATRKRIKAPKETPPPPSTYTKRRASSREKKNKKNKNRGIGQHNFRSALFFWNALLFFGSRRLYVSTRASSPNLSLLRKTIERYIFTRRIIALVYVGI